MEIYYKLLFKKKGKIMKIGKKKKKNYSQYTVTS